MTHRALPLRATMITVGIPWYAPERGGGGTLGAEDVVAFIDAGQQDAAEERLP